MFRRAMIAISIIGTLLLQSCVYEPFGLYNPNYSGRRFNYDDDYYRRDRYPERDRRHYRPRYDDREMVDRRDEIPPPPREVSSDRRVDEQKVVEETPAPKLPPKEIAQPSATTSSRKEVPVATRSGKPGRVKSPFPPFTELDITGLNSGSLAKDPGTGQVFRVP
jgi:hypothetical protein